MRLYNEQIAAISVFGAYKAKNKDAYDVIADFTKSAIAIKKEVQITPEVIQGFLRELYALEIPISIIKGVLKNRLKDFVSNNGGAFIVKSMPADDITSQINELLGSYNVILSGLKDFLTKEKVNPSTYKSDEEYMVSQFAKFIIDDYADDKLVSYFSAYIISMKEEPDFRSYFERFSAGLISYYGLQYFDNTNNIGSWPKDAKLTIFVDTEFLFDCAGYNDLYYKKIFDEFKSLVDEINKPYKEKPVIELKCLTETKSSFDRVFNTVKSLIEKKQAPDPSKEAILKIVSNSHDELDVETHKAKILAEVKNYAISFDTNDYSSFSVDPRYVTFGEAEYEKYLNEYNQQYFDNAEGKIDYYTKVLTIINGLRGGVSKTSFEGCRYIFLSNSRIGHKISYDQAKNNNNAVPLATDIDWLVSRFWYKLNKSLSSNRIPLSLDIVARSQASLSEDVCSLIRTRFEDIKKKNLTDEVKQQLYAGIRTIPKEIELYDSSNLPEILEFISYDSTEAYITAQHKMKEAALRSEENKLDAQRSKAALEKEREEKAEILRENMRLKREKRQAEHKKIVRKIKCKYLIYNILYWVLFMSIAFFIGFIVYKTFNLSDLWNWLLSIIVEASSIIGYFVFIHKKTHKYVSRRNMIRCVIKQKK